MDVSAYLYLWAVATCMSVLVTVSWDLRMDWGLLQGNGLLKEELVYSREVNTFIILYSKYSTCTAHIQTHAKELLLTMDGKSLSKGIKL